MQKIRWFAGSALVAYLDLCVGALIGTLVLPLFGIEPTLPALALAAVLALLPDFDIIPGVLRQRVEGNHRTTLWHRPLVLLPTATVVAWIVGGPGWGAVAFICVLWHYLHDTPPLGPERGGIAWAWPWSDTFITPLGLISPMAWTNDKQKEMLENMWLSFTPRSITEFTLATAILLYIVTIVWL